MDGSDYAALMEDGETIAVFALDPSSSFEWNGVLGMGMKRIKKEDYEKFKTIQKGKTPKEKVRITFHELKVVQHYLDSKAKGAGPGMQKSLHDLASLVNEDLRDSLCPGTRDGLGKHDWKYFESDNEPHARVDSGYYVCQRKGCGATYLE